MQDSLRGFFGILLILWAVLILAAFFYSREQDIAARVAVPVTGAFLFEAACYLGAGWPAVRKRLERLPKVALAALMVGAGFVPYLIYAPQTGMSSAERFGALVLLLAVASCWYLVLRKGFAADAGFLLLMAAPILFKLFPWIYLDPLPRVSLAVLGVLAWYRTGFLAVLSLRKMGGIGFGFVPLRREWGIGAVNFVLFLGIGFLLAYLTGFISLRSPEFTLRIVLIAAGTFFGTLWVLAAAEELFFRGILQQLLVQRLRSTSGGIVVASVIFGLAHLGFRDFPNWQFALLATVAGLFYGRAYVQAGSVRAAMVTHALVVTTWRVFLP